MTQVPRKVLIIDDEPEVLALLVDLMTYWGFDTHAVGSALEGLRRLKSERYDLVLTDLSMPEMSGWSVVAAVRKMSPAPKIIMVTGSATAAEVRQAQAQGLVLLHKPVRFRALKDVVDRVLAGT
jgi:CheY-like chemotaxis protein